MNLRMCQNVYVWSLTFFPLQLSTKVIQGGNPEQLDRLKKSLDEQHRQEREAAEAELDAQENEQIRQATLAIDEDHTVSLKDIHRDILKQVC